MVNGEIVFYNHRPEAEYGFIEVEQFDEDVYFNMDKCGLDEEPEEGMRVKFDTVNESKGKHARNMSVIN